MDRHYKMLISRVERLGIPYFVPAIVVAAIVLFGIVKLDNEEYEQYRAAQRLSAAEELAKVTTSLDSNIHGSINLVQGLVASVAANPGMTKVEFQAIAERIFGAPSQLRNIAAAPDLAVRYVYPEKGNEAVIGLDYTSNTEQYASVLAAIKRRTLVLNGPVKLVQGGTGLIARYPVFSVGNGRFWGIISAVIDIDRLYRDSDIGTETQSLDIAISQRPFPQSNDILYGKLDVFSQQPVQTSVELGYDTWYVAAVPKGGWKLAPPQNGLFRFYAALVAIGIFVPLLWAGVLMRQRQRNTQMLKQREEQLATTHHRLALALEASRIGVWEYEPETDRLTWDARLLELFQAPAGRTSFSLEDWKRVTHPDDIGMAGSLLQKSIDECCPYITQFRIYAADGSIRHIRAHGTTYITPSGVMRIVGANWDVTDDIDLQEKLRDARSQAEQQNDQLRAARQTLEHQSLHDALTGLPNRRYLDHFMEDMARTKGNAACAFIHFDLDRFKEVNDTLGHAAGDEVLRQATARLTGLIAEGDFAARIGGDEFVVIVSGVLAEEHAKKLARAIVQALGKPIMVDGNHCHIGCSAGVASRTNDDETPRQLLINADVALYEAKKRGRNRMELFSRNLLLTAIETKKTADDLIIALDRHEIVPYFQPQFDARTLAIVGVEALARWRHPERGLLMPAQFLGAAEDLHRLGEIDAIVLQKAQYEFMRWRAKGIDVPRLSVNISAQRLTDETLLQQLSKNPFPAGTLSFELLESISFDEDDKARKKVIESLRKLGIDIEIDDFGTGHASIVSLLELAPKRLKIDRRLIAPLKASGSQRRLVASIIEIGQSQGIEIVAEGVETIAHAEILQSLGCHVLQGYAFARPMSAEEFAEFAENWQTDRANHLPVRQAG